MYFEFTEDQRMLRDSVNRLLSDNYNFEVRRAVAATELGYSETLWQHFATLGLTAMPIATDYGGLGSTPMDALPIHEAFGHALVLEPYLASVVLGATAMQLSGDAVQCERLLPAVADASKLLAFAHDEAAGHQLPLWVETRARNEPNGWVLDGVKSNVLHGQCADKIVVTARVAGAAADHGGLGLFLVDGAASGLDRRGFRLLDDTPAAEITLHRVSASPLGEVGTNSSAIAAIEGTVRAAIAALCAQAVGVMQGAYDLTLSYLLTRQQFGRAIGENQALRHRAAEMLVALETSRSAAIMAAMAVNGQGSREATRDVLRAKLLVGRHGRMLCHQAIQLHGGIGMTEEYSVGHYLRRITVIDHLFGDEHVQAARLGAALAGHNDE
jgi:pimeloyl-CoA dehydrogenase